MGRIVHTEGLIGKLSDEMPESYQSFVITRMQFMPDVPFILSDPEAAINVVHSAGRYAVHVGTRKDGIFAGNITPRSTDLIPAGMTPEKIAEAEAAAIGEPYVHAFINGKPYPQTMGI